MSLVDRFGNTVTATSADAVQKYVEALDELFAMQPGCGNTIGAALELEPDFALAHCVQARALVIEGRNSEAMTAIDRAEALAERRGSGSLNEWERDHLRIVAMVTRGATAQALPLVVSHAERYPRDALSLSFAVGVYGLYGFGGYVDHHERQLELLRSVESQWTDDWWFLTSLGWSYVETGKADVGVPMLDRALELRPDSANAAHGRSHGYYELGEVGPGEQFIVDWLPSYDVAGPLHCHLAWHQALFALQQGEVEHAWEIFHRYIRPDVSQAMPMFTIIDCAALLWRFRLQGCAVDEADIADLVAFMEHTFPSTSIPFVNVHAMLVYALAGDTEALTRRLDEVADLVVAGKQNCGEVVLRVVQAIAAFERRAPAQAAVLLDQARAGWAALGGSNAQRDVLLETLVAAVVQKGDLAVARKLAADRAAVRAPHLDEEWFKRFATGGSARP